MQNLWAEVPAAQSWHPAPAARLAGHAPSSAHRRGRSLSLRRGLRLGLALFTCPIPTTQCGAEEGPPETLPSDLGAHWILPGSEELLRDFCKVGVTGPLALNEHFLGGVGSGKWEDASF